MNKCMRTNIVLNDELVAEAMALAHVTSKTALVELALRTFVASRTAQQRRERYQQRLLTVRQEVGSRAYRQSSTDIVRRDRDR